MTDLPTPSVLQRDLMRVAKHIYRRPDGVAVINSHHGHHRIASKKILSQLLTEKRWLDEPQPGTFALTATGIAALARSPR